MTKHFMKALLLLLTSISATIVATTPAMAAENKNTPVTPGYTNYGYEWLKNASVPPDDRVKLMGLYDVLAEFYGIAASTADPLLTIGGVDVSALNILYNTPEEKSKAESIMGLAAAVFEADNPQYYFIGSENSYRVKETDGVKKVVEFVAGLRSLYDSNETRLQQNQSIESKFAEYAELTASAAGDYEKARLVHDKMIDEREYSFDNGSPDENDYAHTIVGVLDASTKGPVCESYAKAYAYILHRLNIDAIYITGLSQGLPHAWNMVKLDNQWYYCDVTYDARLRAASGQNDSYHMYFMVGAANESFSASRQSGDRNGLNGYYLYDLPPASLNDFNPVTNTQSLPDALYEMRLLSGTGTKDGAPIYELSRSLTRIEALSLSIRLMGLEEAASAFAGQNPFTDTPAWADRIAAFAYNKGITVGVDYEHTQFDPNRAVSYQEFTAFMLHVLGYDFAYDDVFTKALEVRLYNTLDENLLNGTKPYLRKDMAVSVAEALLTNPKDSPMRLIDILTDSGVILRDAAERFLFASNDWLSAA